MNKIKVISYALLSLLTLTICTACSGDDRQAQREAEQNGVSVVTVAATQTTTQATTKATTTTIATTAATTAKATEKPTEPPTEAPTEPPTEKPTEPKTKFYYDGMYKVGTDIEEGEYFVYSTGAYGGYICVSSDANQNDITYNQMFGNNLIITIKDGEYLKLQDCTAMSGFDDFVNSKAGLETYKTLMEDEIDQGGMYQIGTMLDAGEYKLESTGSTSGYYCIYSDSRHDDIVANDLFDGSTYVNVSNGEYLLLQDCKIAE